MNSKDATETPTFKVHLLGARVIYNLLAKETVYGGF